MEKKLVNSLELKSETPFEHKMIIKHKRLYRVGNADIISLKARFIKAHNLAQAWLSARINVVDPK